MESLKKYLRLTLIWSGKLEITLCKILMCWIVLLTGISVVLRYGFNYSLHWSQEITLLCAQYLYFIGAAYLFKTREYIIIEFLFERFPDSVKVPCAMFMHIVMLIFLGIVFWQGYLMQLVEVNIQSFVLNWPRNYWSLPILLSSVSIGFTLLYYLLGYLDYYFGKAGGTKTFVQLEERSTLFLTETQLKDV
jgi:C4-dicarboxylate transporter DctQ subunit